MKITITIEETCDDLGRGWSSEYSYEGVETAEDFLWTIGQASKTVFDFNHLSARQDYTVANTGERRYNLYEMDI